MPLYALLVFAVDATLISLARWLHGGLAGTRVRDAPWGRTIVVGALVLRERHPAGRMAGAAVIFAGLVVIALAH